MAESNAIPSPDRIPREDEFSLNYAFDAGFISGDQPPDSPSSGDSESDSSGSKGRSELVGSLRVFSEAMLRMEMAELEMMKAREAARLAAENRRLETEVELTQLILKTQLQVASVVRRMGNGRKRKRASEESSER